MFVKDILSAVEMIAPPSLAFEWDRIGLQIGDPDAEVTGIATTLDASPEILERCAQERRNVLITHHPIIWDPLKSITPSVPLGATVMSALRKEVHIIAAHTNWDAAPGGVSDTMAAMLGLQNVRAFGPKRTSNALKMVVYSPAEHRDNIVSAAGEQGAGVIGDYSHCSFTTPGLGTFLPGEGANPTLGSVGQFQKVPEDRIEMIVPSHARARVEQAVRAVHPYEEPALDFFVLSAEGEVPLVRLGELNSSASLSEFATAVEMAFESKCWCSGRPESQIRRVAVAGGASADFWRLAKAQGADAMVTGEAKHSEIVAACEANFPLILAGHYATEAPAMQALAVRLNAMNLGSTCEFFEAPQGTAGRNW